MIGRLLKLLQSKPKRIYMHFAEGDQVNAIKSYRYLMGCSLKEAKDAILNRSEQDSSLIGYRQIILYCEDTEAVDGLDLFGNCFVTIDN